MKCNVAKLFASKGLHQELSNDKLKAGTSFLSGDKSVQRF